MEDLLRQLNEKHNEVLNKKAELFSNDYELFKFVEEVLALLGYVFPLQAQRNEDRLRINQLEAEIDDLRQQIDNYIEEQKTIE